jgi:anti-sigma regulatory factor (Ser/Thr protein kinase)
MPDRSTPMVPSYRSASWELPSDPQAVSTARALTRDTLAKWGLHDEIDDVVLVVSEVVTNAVVHAEAPIELALQKHGRSVRGAVSDRSVSRPQLVTAGADQLSGRGMAIVQAMTSRWGTQLLPEHGGKAVWFEFRRSPDRVVPPSLDLLLWGVPGLGSGLSRGDLNAPSFGSRFGWPA